MITFRCSRELRQKIRVAAAIADASIGAVIVNSLEREDRLGLLGEFEERVEESESAAAAVTASPAA